MADGVGHVHMFELAFSELMDDSSATLQPFLLEHHHIQPRPNPERRMLAFFPDVLGFGPPANPPPKWALDRRVVVDGRACQERRDFQKTNALPERPGRTQVYEQLVLAITAQLPL